MISTYSMRNSGFSVFQHSGTPKQLTFFTGGMGVSFQDRNPKDSSLPYRPKIFPLEKFAHAPCSKGLLSLPNAFGRRFIKSLKGFYCLLPFQHGHRGKSSSDTLGPVRIKHVGSAVRADICHLDVILFKSSL
jgi:hypothetical protein